jgi:hypothetical protein
VPEPTSAEIHTLLLGLAGRAPDAWLMVTRASLADGDREHVAQTVAALTRSGLVFSEREAATVSALVSGQPDASAPTTGSVPGPAQRFEPGDDRPVSGLPGAVTALWRAVRSDGLVVHLVEASDGADLVTLTGQVQRLLGSPVEVFAADTELPPYHRAALGAATLVALTPAPVHLARVFDGADPHQGPFFVTDRERVDEQRRERLLAYLCAGEPVLEEAGELDDVLEPGVSVPTGFRSDGTWVWNEATVHYLDRHGVAPDPDLASHVDACPPTPAGLRRSERARVRAALTAGPSDPANVWHAG